jgi:hypothetical protein
MKSKTLRRNRAYSKRTYLKKGGKLNEPLDYKIIQDAYTANLEAKKELYNSIQSTGSHIYDIETSNKNMAQVETMNEIISFIKTFNDSLKTTYNNKEEDIQNNLEKYGIEYTNYFIPVLKELNTIINVSEENLLFAENIQQQFVNKKVLIHLIKNRGELINLANNKTNTINLQFQNTLKKLDSIFDILIKESKQKDLEKQAKIQELTVKKTQLTSAISYVSRPLPDGFILTEPSFVMYAIIFSRTQCVFMR